MQLHAPEVVLEMTLPAHQHPAVELHAGGAQDHAELSGDA